MVKLVWRRRIALLLAVVWLAACGQVNELYSDLNGWVTREDVETALGEPLPISRVVEWTPEWGSEYQAAAEGSILMVFTDLDQQSSRKMLTRLYSVIDQTRSQQTVSIFNIQDISEEDHAEVRIRKIDTLPTVLVIREGQEMGRISGSPKIDFEEQLLVLLQIPAPSEFG